MNQEITIRKYTPADRDEVIELLRLNTPKYFATTEEEDLIYYLENHSDNYYVLEYYNRIAGCGGFNFSDDLTIGKISWDIFHPSYQGQGFGSILTKYRIEKMLEYDSIKIISVRTSQLVYKFYEKLGFTLKEIIKDYWAEGFDMYRMEFPIEANH